MEAGSLPVAGLLKYVTQLSLRLPGNLTHRAYFKSQAVLNLPVKCHRESYYCTASARASVLALAVSVPMCHFHWHTVTRRHWHVTVIVPLALALAMTTGTASGTSLRHWHRRQLLPVNVDLWYAFASSTFLT